MQASISEMDGHCCESEGMPEDCCSDEAFQVAETQDFIYYNFEWTAMPPILAVAIPFFFEAPALQQYQPQHINTTLSNRKQDIYILVQSFLN